MAARDMGWIYLPLYAYDPAAGSYLTAGFEPWRNWSALPPWRGCWMGTNRDNLSLIPPAS